MEIGRNEEFAKAKVSLRSARVGSLDVSACAHESVKWDLDGLQYEAIENVENVKAVTQANKQMEGIEVWTAYILSDRGRTRQLQPFDELIAFLRETGREKDANMVGIAKENQITTNMCCNKSTSLFQMPLLEVLLFRRLLIRLFVRYGYEPERGVCWLIGLICLGTVIFGGAAGAGAKLLGPFFEVHYVFPTQTIYFVAGNAVAAVPAHGTRALDRRDGILRALSSLQSRTSEKAHSVEDPQEIAHVPPLNKEEYPEFWPFWYSLELATPLPSLGQEDHWDVEGVWWLEFYKIFHVIFG